MSLLLLPREYGLHFVFVCKPASHPALYEELAGLARLGAVHTFQVTRWNGRAREQDTFRFARALPLRGSADALAVNFVEITTTTSDGTVLSRNAFATDHPVDEASVVEPVKAGRSRWKIENGNFNTLKTKGYHLEHNFGHGRRHLAALLASLNLLAFLVRTLTELLDPRWQVIRAALPTRQTFHDDLRALTRYLVLPAGMVDQASERGRDNGKQVTGRKRHLLVDTLGLTLAVKVTAANVTDHAGAKLLLEKLLTTIGFGWVRVVWADTTDHVHALRAWIKTAFFGRGLRLEVVSRPTEQKGFVPQKKRWRVERTFGWLNRCRRLSKDYEVKTAHSETMIRISSIRSLLDCICLVVPRLSALTTPGKLD